MKRSKISEFPFYPLLFAIFPVLSTLGVNIREVYFKAGLRSLLVALGIGILFYLVFWLMTRKTSLAGLLSLWSVILFYSYGYIFKDNSGLIVWGLFWLIACVLMIRHVKVDGRLSLVLNIVALFLLITPLVQILSFSINQQNSNQAAQQMLSTQQLTPPDSPPDVYLIVLDSHLRSDVLLETFDLDNSDFTNELESMGFNVLDCAMSNYAYTPLSMASMLNLDYISTLAPDLQPPKTDRTLLFELIKQSSLRRSLEEIGYSTYNIVSYQPLAWEDASHYMATDANSISNSSQTVIVNSFESLVSEPTLAKPLLKLLARHVQSDSLVPIDYLYADDARQQLFIQKKLTEIVPERGPKFVFAHINIPHPPYVFNADGSLIQDPPPLPWVTPIPWDDYLGYYSNHVQYIDSAILPIIKTILNSSDNPPVIVIVGDHGADSANRLGVLSAYFLPSGLAADIPEHTSLVNGFRYVFNHVFGANLPILENSSYLSTQTEPYKFVVYPETMPNCTP
jgi:hypothetical protein